MARMTEEMIEACYRGGVEVSEGRAIHHHERDRIVAAIGMNQASASYYLSAVDALLSGGNIRYDINSKAVDRYLENIRTDYGIDALKTASDVCMRRYEETKKLGNACHYYKRIAEEYLRKIDNEN